MGQRRRDADAWFTREVAIHLDAVYRYFLRRADAQHADDLTAEVFETAWRRRADVPEEWVLPWLYRTAGFVLANHRRRPRLLQMHEAEEPVDGDHARRIADRDELQRALAGLTERDRDILLLHAWEGLTGDELAETLGISRSGAQAALSRARARLRERWADAVEVQDGGVR